MNRIEIDVPPSLGGERLDRVLALVSGLSRRQVASLIAQGAVTVSGEAVLNRSRQVSEGDHIVADTAGIDDNPVNPDPKVVFGVIEADEQLIVVDKPAGLAVHRGAGQRCATLVDGLLARFEDLAYLAAAGVGDPARPGIVHRLDKQTSGLLVVARTQQAFSSLSAQFKAHTARRRYVALVLGHLDSNEGTIDAPIGRSIRQPARMAVTYGGRRAVTRYWVKSRFSVPLALTLLEAELETGRTHQIRVHLAAIGHPVVGDDRYGKPSPARSRAAHLLAPGRHFLHAAQLAVDDPIDGRRRSWTSPLPADLVESLAALA